MEINSLNFFCFFLIVFILYYIPFKSTRNFQNRLLLISSWIFYLLIDYRTFPILLISTISFWILGEKIAQKTKREAQRLQLLGIASGVILLLYFKYYNFFLSSFSSFLSQIGIQANWNTLDIILPVGISFYIFKLISYLIEIEKKNISPCHNFLDFATYTAFFPTITSGPIDRPYAFLPQLNNKRDFNYQLATDGMQQILWGIFKKMVIADNIATIVDNIWGNYSQEYATTLIWTSILYSIQIYADFSGYSDMSIGVGKLLGFNISTNFRKPYFTRNMAEFWRNWHISLTSWFMDYIYKPLGGSRVHKMIHLRNILIVFIVSGLWHGANWTFVLWGAYHGFILCLLAILHTPKYKEPIANKTLYPSFKELLQMGMVFMLSTIGWILFRADTINDAIKYFNRILTTSWLHIPSIYPNICIYILLMVTIEWITRKYEHPFQIQHRLTKYILYCILSYLIIYHQGQPSGFIYFQF